MRLRASVIHGNAPDVFDSSKYASYYENYGDDPVDDLDLLVTECLRVVVFNGQLSEHEDPDKEVIEKLRAMRRWPDQKREGILASHT
jgi:hypothetical protein